MATKELIQTVTVGASGAVSIDFTNIPQGFTDLLVTYSTRPGSADGSWVQRLRFNGLSSNQTARGLDGTGSATENYTASELPLINQASGSTANTFSNGQIYIPNYSTTRNKSISVDGVAENNATQAFQRILSGLWSSADSITQISLIAASTYAQYSSVSLYGIRSGSNGITLPVATGGTVSTTGSYTVHTFTASDTFTLNKAVTGLEYLVVAGGGGGASAYWGSGGGGGAGGYRSSVAGESSGGGASAEAKLSLTPGKYSVIVGAGGATGTTYGNGYNGGNSAFDQIISIGGGSGGYTAPDRRGMPGGSGGGGGYGGSGGGGTGTTGQGYAGGNHIENSCGPGGGGAAGVGATADLYLGGRPGGSGVSSGINGTATYRAGGGGGGRYLNEGPGPGAGGNGGGGAGAQHNGTATAGTANTGGGGGGGGSDSGGTSVGGAGGSGIVIIRYPTPA